MHHYSSLYKPCNLLVRVGICANLNIAMIVSRSTSSLIQLSSLCLQWTFIELRGCMITLCIVHVLAKCTVLLGMPSAEGVCHMIADSRDLGFPHNHTQATREFPRCFPAPKKKETDSKRVRLKGLTLTRDIYLIPRKKS